VGSHRVNVTGGTGGALQPADHIGGSLQPADDIGNLTIRYRRSLTAKH
jgi:hypothetical protein